MCVLRRNVAYASTCNSVGQSAGYFLGYVVFMALHSPDLTNKYLRSVPEPTGLVTISSKLCVILYQKLNEQKFIFEVYDA